jgi:hypothetical protein
MVGNQTDRARSQKKKQPAKTPTNRTEQMNDVMDEKIDRYEIGLSAMWSEEKMVLAHSVTLADEHLTRIGLTRAAVYFVCDPTQRRNSAASFVLQCVFHKRYIRALPDSFRASMSELVDFANLFCRLYALRRTRNETQMRTRVIKRP